MIDPRPAWSNTTVSEQHRETALVVVMSDSISPARITVLTFLLECGMNVHHKCQTKVANLCGINQKLLAEALNQVSQVRFVSICQ